MLCAYLFKSSHLLLDSVHKSPLYYKAKRKEKNKTKHFFLFPPIQVKKQLQDVFIPLRNRPTRAGPKAKLSRSGED